MSADPEAEGQTLTINDEVYELEVELNPLIATKDVHIELKRKESSWANIQPNATKSPPIIAKENGDSDEAPIEQQEEEEENKKDEPMPEEEESKEEKEEEEKPKEVDVEERVITPPSLKKRGRKPKSKESKRRISSREKKPIADANGKEEEQKVDEEKAEESSEGEPEETYELEKIIDHRIVKKRKKPVNEFLVRWLGYGAESDSWEPEENILGESAKEQITIFWEERKQEKLAASNAAAEAEEAKPDAKDTEKALSEPPAKKQKVEESPAASKKRPGRPKSSSISTPTSEKPSSTPATDAKEDEVMPNEPPKIPTDSEGLAMGADVKPDFSSSGGSGFDSSTDTNTWYGIKEEDIKNKAAKREMKNLYVANRIPSLSEKLLADFGSTSRGRVTRSSLKPLKEDIDPSPRQSKTPEPSSSMGGRRGRRTVSPAASTSNRYSPEPPAPKRARKSMPAIKEPKEEAAAKKTTPASDTATVKEELSSSDIPSTSTADAPKLDSSASSSSKGVPKSKKSGPTPITLVPQISLIPEKVRSTAHPKSSEGTQPGKLPPTIRVRPLQTKPRTSSPKDTVQSPLILDPFANRSLIFESPASGMTEKEIMDDPNIMDVLTQDDFQPLKDMPYPEIDMEKCFEEVTTAGMPVKKLAKNYDEFVAAVLTGDADVVYATAMLGLFDLKLNEVDSKGKSLIHHIAERKCDPNHAFDTIIEVLVQKKADLTIVDKENLRTALHTAIILRHTCLAKILVQLGSPVNTLDAKRFSPLMSAINTRDPILVKLLLNAGANVEKAIIYSERSKTITDEISEMLVQHRAKIVACLDEARHYILPQAAVSTYSTLPTTLYISPVAESDVIEYAFHLTKDTTIRPPNNYLLFECAVLEIDGLNESMSARMWQQSPIKKIIVNGTEPINLHKTTNFICLPPLFEGTNSVRIELMNQVYKGTKFCITARLAHVFMAGFSKSRRLEPTVGNLLPQMMGNPSGYRTQVTPGIRQLSNELRPKYFRTPAQQQYAAAVQQHQPQQQVYHSPSPRMYYPPQPSRTPPVTTGSYYRSVTSTFIPATYNEAIRSPTTSSSPQLPPGFVPLKTFSNGSGSQSSSSSSVRSGANRPTFAPLSAASNRIALKPSSSSTSPSTASTIPRLQRQ